MTAGVRGRLSTAAAAIDPGGMARFARVAGSSIAGRDAAAWVTHFLNASYYGVPRETRDLENLRIAWGVLTTYWHRLGGGPLRAYHLRQVHQSFRAARSADGSQYPRGLLDRDQLEGGAARLLGPWFGEARSDPTRIGWGVVFETPADRALYVPEVRLRRSRLGPISPPTAPPSEQMWHTYQQVPIPGVDDVVAVLEATESWSHFATDVGRFTALRSGPLRGQTFEVEAIAELARHLPMLTRAYVTVTWVLDRSQAEALRDRVAVRAANVARRGADEPEVLPATGRPTHLIELTTHAGHFLGLGRNYLLLFESDDGAYVRAIGNWDPMPWYVRLSYAYEGANAQRMFWGLESPGHSMLRQFARAAARRSPCRVMSGRGRRCGRRSTGPLASWAPSIS